MHPIEAVAQTGIITTVAGTGVPGFSGDGGLATEAQLQGPAAVMFDGSGSLFIADTNNRRIRKVDAGTGIITTVAGTGVPGFSGDGGLATAAQLDSPFDIAVDGGGNVFIPDHNNNRVRMVDAVTGIITTVAGTGVPGFSGDGGLATEAQLQAPAAVALDAGGNLYINDQNNNRIRKVDARTGVITTVAGTGAIAPVPNGFGGDGGPATEARLFTPTGIRLDASGNLFIADNGNNRIRMVDAVTGIITTVAGTGVPGFSGDGGLATGAQLRFPSSAIPDASGNLFIADQQNSRIRKVDAGTGIITTVAGTGAGGFSGDGGLSTEAQVNVPRTVAFDASGNLYIADSGNHRIRMILMTIAVHIEIKPGSFPNSINPNSRGKIPVAILSSSTFDAPSQVNQGSLTFGRTGSEPSLAFCNSNGEDVNNDGLLDLVCHFHTLTANFQPGDTQGVLKGQSVGGIPLSGTDSVRIVP